MRDPPGGAPLEVSDVQRHAWLGLAALAAAAMLAGCGGGDGDLDGGATARYLPLAIGNEWHYDTIELTAVAQTASARRTLPPRRPGRVTTAQGQWEEIITITDTVQSAGTWYVATLEWVGDSSFDEKFLRHDSRGLLWRDDLSDPGYYRLRTPLRVGNYWFDPMDDRRSFEIVSTNDTVSTEAGLFRRCLVVEDVLDIPNEPLDVITTWFAPDVGLVKETQHIGSNLVFTSELIGYAVNPIN